jgi:CubicO group peptidase (beta-lactamase class C family)
MCTFVKRYAGFFSIAVFLFLFTGCGSNSGSQVNYAAAIDEGRRAVREIMEETGAASVSVALVDGERVIWSEAFGTADREAGLTATTETLYGACSISKILATLAVMMLVDSGEISLDEPVITYIPDFFMPLDERYRDITVRMLLNHSSGIPGYEPGSVTSAPFPGYAARMMDEMVYQRLIYEPGTISAYNNDGFTMVENLIKAVTGEFYPDFVRRRILEPLGMRSSQFQNIPLPETSWARAYDGEKLFPPFCLNVYASGGFYATPEELSRVARMLINQGVLDTRRILSPESVAAMGQDQRLGSFDPVPCEENRYGLGWDTVTQPGLGAVGIRAWQKTGDLTGVYGTNMAVLPEEKLGVVVFGASGSMATPFSSSHAVKISNRILLRALVERGRLSEMPEPLSADSLPIEEVPEEQKRMYSGVYASSLGVFRLRYEAGDAVTLDLLEGTDWNPLYANLKLRSDGWYAGDDDPVTALRLLSRQERFYCALRQKGTSPHYSYSLLVGQRLEENSPPLSAAWEARLRETWLPVNQDLSIAFPGKDDAPGFRFCTVPGLGSYLWGNNILGNMNPPSENRLDGKFLIVPDSVRGMEDAAMESWNGQEWLRLGSYLYRPLSEVPLLEEGESSVSIGSEGFGGWLRLPSSGTLSIEGSVFWFVYDSGVQEIDSGEGRATVEFSGTEVHYVLLRGEPETEIALRLSTP